VLALVLALPHVWHIYKVVVMLANTMCVGTSGTTIGVAMMSINRNTKREKQLERVLDSLNEREATAAIYHIACRHNILIAQHWTRAAWNELHAEVYEFETVDEWEHFVYWVRDSNIDLWLAEELREFIDCFHADNAEEQCYQARYGLLAEQTPCSQNEDEEAEDAGTVKLTDALRRSHVDNTDVVICEECGESCTDDTSYQCNICGGIICCDCCECDEPDLICAECSGDEEEDGLSEGLEKYIDPHHPEFDLDFSKEIIGSRPDWFTDEEKLKISQLR
jgi:hypothetical protein